MITSLFSHAGHAHTAESMDMATTIDHCMPIILGAGIVIVLLVAVIVYLLAMWQPKTAATPKRKGASKKK